MPFTFQTRTVFSPIPDPLAWQIEAFLVKIFEYGNFSFRSALRGTYDENLQCVFTLAICNGDIIAAAGCLYPKDNPQIALIGPVAVCDEMRHMGIGRILLTTVTDHLQAGGCKAAFLAVRNNPSAWRLYLNCGFVQQSGIVMRKLFCPESLFDDIYRKSNDVIIRPANWSDFPAVSALLLCPSTLITADYLLGIFSTSLTPCEKFLTVFSDMTAHCDYFKLLVSKEQRSVVGFARIAHGRSWMTSHIGTIEFFVHDNFLDEAAGMVACTVDKAGKEHSLIQSFCSVNDNNRLEILQACGFHAAVSLPEQLNINGKHTDVLLLTR